MVLEARVALSPGSSNFSTYDIGKNGRSLGWGKARHMYMHAKCLSLLVPITIATGITTHIIEGTGGDSGS